MVLLRRVIGDALRARRQGQHRTLREVSTAANVSLGYLSEIERGQKEASSELLAAICDALGARLSELLGEVSDTLSVAEGMPGVLVPVEDGKRSSGDRSSATPSPASQSAAPQSAAPQSAAARSAAAQAPAAQAPATRAPAARSRAAQATAASSTVRRVATDGSVSVSVRQETPLKATLRATRKVSAGKRERDVIYAA